MSMSSPPEKSQPKDYAGIFGDLNLKCTEIDIVAVCRMKQYVYF